MSIAQKHIVCPGCGIINRVPDGRPVDQAKCGSCRDRLFTGMPQPVNSDQFARHLARDDILLVVDFWAPWCGPCRAMAPAFERAAKDLEPACRLLKVNTEDAPDLAARYGIRSIPTLMMFSRGHPVAQSAGARDYEGIVAWVTSQESKL